jgi:hypothetical protein
MTRTVLPNRRKADIFDLRFGEIDYVVTVGRYVSGAVAEVFISCHKAGSTVANLARDAAVILSLALQHGTPLATLAAGVTREEDGRAAGLAGTVLDEIVRREAAPRAEPAPVDVADPPPTRPAIGFLAGHTHAPMRSAAALAGFSGEICTNCHAAAMVRTGTCLTCQACGGTSGGCS